MKKVTRGSFQNQFPNKVPFILHHYIANAGSFTVSKDDDNSSESSPANAKKQKNGWNTESAQERKTQKETEEEDQTTGRWTKEEQQKFLEALDLFGKDWKKVQAYVGTRTTTQARSHAQKYFAKKDKAKMGEPLVEDKQNSSYSQSQASTALNSPACKPAPETPKEKSNSKNEAKRSSTTVVKSVKRKLAYQEEPAVKTKVICESEEKKKSRVVKRSKGTAASIPEAPLPNAGEVTEQHEEHPMSWMNAEGCYSMQCFSINGDAVNECNPNVQTIQQLPEPHVSEHNIEFDLEDLKVEPTELLELSQSTVQLSSERLFSCSLDEPLFSADFSDIPDLLNSISKA